MLVVTGLIVVTTVLLVLVVVDFVVVVAVVVDSIVVMVILAVGVVAVVDCMVVPKNAYFDTMHLYQSKRFFVAVIVLSYF